MRKPGRGTSALFKTGMGKGVVLFGILLLLTSCGGGGDEEGDGAPGVGPPAVAPPATGPSINRIIAQDDPGPGEPNYLIIQDGGTLQYWVDEQTEVITETLITLDAEGARVRVFNDEDGAPHTIVEESSGEFVTMRENGPGRTDFWFYDAAGMYTGGMAFYQESGRYYIAEITGVPVHSGRQLAGQMNATTTTLTGSYALIVEGGGLTNIEVLPEELEDFLVQLEEFHGLGDAADDSDGPTVARAPQRSTRAKIVRGASALFGVVVAIKTGRAPAVLGRVIKTAISSAALAHVRGCDMLDSIANAVVDEVSVCNLAVVNLVQKVCDAGIAILAGETDDKTPAQMLAEAALESVAPEITADVKNVQFGYGLGMDVAGYVSRGGRPPMPDPDEMPPYVTGHLRGQAVFQGDHTIHDLEGEIGLDGEFYADGSRLMISGELDGDRISGTYDAGGHEGTIDGDVQSLGECERSFSSGGQGTFSYAHFVGHGEGTVRFAYEAYRIPDAFTLSTSQGLKYSTGGLVSGQGITHLDISDEPTVFINVTAPQTGTLWEYVLGCLE